MARPKKAMPPARSSTKKKRAPGGQKPKPKPKVQSEQLYTLQVTREMLEHLRDLFGVLLPPDGQVSVSQFLAAVTGRQELENNLFTIVEDTCIDAGVPTGDDAPDYVVMPISPPPMGVFQARLEDVSDGDESCESCPPTGRCPDKCDENR
jgi:hypothetical protein